VERPGDEDPSGEEAECGQLSFGLPAATGVLSQKARRRTVQQACGAEARPRKECQMASNRESRGCDDGCIFWSLRISVNRSSSVPAAATNMAALASARSQQEFLDDAGFACACAGLERGC
jgi:hypothetical protein